MSQAKNKLLVFVVGPTAIGKTSLSIELASLFDCQIISADSRQFYREMHIGTAKPSEDQLKQVTHHFINSKSVLEEYNVFDFERDVLKQAEELFKNSDIAIVVGGSGLYLHSIWNGIDENIPASDPKLRNELNDLFKK